MCCHISCRSLQAATTYWSGIPTVHQSQPSTPAASPLPGLTGLVLMAPHVFVEDISVDGIKNRPATPGTTTDLRDRLRRHHGKNVDTAFLGWNDSWLHPGFRTWDITGFLPLIIAPVLAIQGRDDDYGTLAQLGRDRTILRRPGHKADS